MKSIESKEILLPELRKEYFERTKVLVLNALDLHFGNKTIVSKKLGVNRTTLVMWLKRHAPERLQYEL